jgi:hypothetical protein
VITFFRSVLQNDDEKVNVKVEEGIVCNKSIISKVSFRVRKDVQNFRVSCSWLRHRGVRLSCCCGVVLKINNKMQCFCNTIYSSQLLLLLIIKKYIGGENSIKEVGGTKTSLLASVVLVSEKKGIK